MRLEESSRMASATEGCVDDPTGWYGFEGRHDLVEHHRAVVERFVSFGHD
jgi:hypothetical protein